MFHDLTNQLTNHLDYLHTSLGMRFTQCDIQQELWYLKRLLNAKTVRQLKLGAMLHVPKVTWQDFVFWVFWVTF